MMKKLYKKFIGLILAATMVLEISTTSFAAENSKTVEVITNQNEITQVLKEKGIHEDGEEVVAVIQMNTLEPQSIQPRQSIQPCFIFREIYAQAGGSTSGTKSTAKYTNKYPAGTFHFNQSITSGWQLNANLGLKVEVFETALGCTLNSSTTESWTYDSPYYSYPITVKAYINYEKKYYKIYDADLMYDDYIGRTSIERETGYTIKVTKQ